MELKISVKVAAKLIQKHNVVREEIEECFATRPKGYLADIREDHQTNPPTLWFISETYKGRSLKIAFMIIEGDIVIKTAFKPSDQDIHCYNKFAK